ncbi:MAG TPA: hypothetical protein PLE73_00745 [Spirochaetota bacterium]|nr:hypothetical protein [Spirochaetota bacterium]HPI21693.1 hypothetical protein [Spirochaetota bacterium]HPU88969.1 hypothetical protein [Spirochaetota bacterium]
MKRFTVILLVFIFSVAIPSLRSQDRPDAPKEPAQKELRDDSPADLPNYDDDDATLEPRNESKDPGNGSPDEPENYDDEERGAARTAPKRDAQSMKEGTTSSPFSQSQFVPDISFVLDASYNHRDRDNEIYKTQLRPGFIQSMSGEAEHEHVAPNAVMRGFNFNYAELTLYSVVDPYFDLFAAIELTTAKVLIEEAYFCTTSLPFGFQLKTGKFLSSFGRINEQHAHNWDFYDAPLVYEAFFGGDLNEVGVRATWVAPLDFYLMIGAEALQGANAASFGATGFADPNEIMRVRDSDDPNLGVGYIKTSFDIGDLTVYMGASGAYGRSRINHGVDQAGVAGTAIAAHSHVLGADLTLKYQFDSKRYCALQTEYLYRFMDGAYYAKNETDIVEEYALVKRQSGLYAQLVGKFAMRWRAGIRYDLLAVNDIKLDGIKESLPESLPRYSAMVDFNATEFSRFRLQYNYDHSMYVPRDGSFASRPNHEVVLQVNITIGAHGAHAF